jgi:hypothetical protein
MNSLTGSSADKSPYSPPPASPIPVPPLADLAQLGPRLVQWPSNTEPLNSPDQVALQVACLTIALAEALRRLDRMEAERKARHGRGNRGASTAGARGR